MAILLAGGVIGAFAGKASLAFTGAKVAFAAPAVAAAVTGPVGLSIGVILTAVGGSWVAGNLAADHRVRQSLKQAPPPPPGPLGFWKNHDNLTVALTTLGVLVLACAALFSFAAKKRKSSQQKQRDEDSLLLKHLLLENKEGGGAEAADSNSTSLALVPSGKDGDQQANELRSVLVAVAREVKSVKEDLVVTREGSVTRDSQNLAAIAALQESVAKRDAEVSMLTRELSQVRSMSRSRAGSMEVDRFRQHSAGSSFTGEDGGGEDELHWGSGADYAYRRRGNSVGRGSSVGRGNSVERRSVERQGSVERGGGGWRSRGGSAERPIGERSPTGAGGGAGPWVYGRGGSVERSERWDTVSCASHSSEESIQAWQRAGGVGAWQKTGGGGPVAMGGPVVQAASPAPAPAPAVDPKDAKETDDALKYILSFTPPTSPSKPKPVRTDKPVRAEKRNLESYLETKKGVGKSENKSSGRLTPPSPKSPAKPCTAESMAGSGKIIATTDATSTAASTATASNSTGGNSDSDITEDAQLRPKAKNKPAVPLRTRSFLGSLLGGSH